MTLPERVTRLEVTLVGLVDSNKAIATSVMNHTEKMEASLRALNPNGKLAKLLDNTERIIENASKAEELRVMVAEHLRWEQRLTLLRKVGWIVFGAFVSAGAITWLSVALHLQVALPR